jgi:ArsR family transcriptional regulator, arsenate/arsenite/antimonite-responsive transcriptional repressor
MASHVVTSVAERKRGTRAGTTIAIPFSDAEIQRLSDDLGLLSNPIRLRILAILLEREGWVCVCDLVKTLELKQPTVSHHLKLLKDAGLVEDEKRGVWSYYFVKRDALDSLKGRVASALERMT